MIRKVSEIKDQALIEQMLLSGSYGVLSLMGDRPYGVPLNYIYFQDAIYFHSAPKGEKIRLLKQNPQVSFSVVTEDTIIPSNFSSDEGLACPATAFFKSVIVEGNAQIIEDFDEIGKTFTAMMQNLQPEGDYLPFEDEVYKKKFKALVVVKINIERLSAKFKFGQGLNQKRFQMLLDNLQKRGTKIDLLTIQAMHQYCPKKYKC
ncbi:hypothetical protein THERMOT_220 [Bathymodiolus thermophilus thioautotrophic gill symbiont]|uniref:pyridoxamine 5'-phosphate oxidase family protein n=1 Tax=Bathymodiolus thermophilus thioautotrophic gill symbiont TaxID=2360 RepID=UPI00192B530B|nr:pyridoxamine 5'-phosphate oxidase family protein [Bathymodiolus thermophilus thioautotrophic gill symbiont]CAB5494999.1 hypothetical protein THERMOT_220 [Bathymodiolus thermophilus thioautotrophic gill symbiont]